MMRQLGTILLVFLVILVLTACQPSNLSKTKLSDKEPDGSNKPAIEIQGPMTVSQNPLFAYVGEYIYLDVVLVDGRYYEDWNPSPFMGRNWQGSFQFLIRDADDHILHRSDIENTFFQQVNQFFDLSFADYNGDGDIDFALGQYGTSNGNIYHLYTIREDHSIDKLEIAGRQELFASGGSRNSIELQAWGDHGFELDYYDNSIGKTFTNRYTWENNQFKLQETSEK
ncbi:hypothetical protein [Paenibacillus paeoniae]|uniref:VCBS repeat-containing protein n=1 Tax=Paenibacillus paeoniae TaxID=2292705 RepID=A0A371PLY5_9BACL|nr:hypothetical protein [Paenibacillus paeoniae]REK77005.1 hypothetical protein DX130_08340 [Paenibacillus paeoniae]